MPAPVYPIAPWTLWAIRAIAAGWAIYDGFFTGGTEERAPEALPRWHRAEVIFGRNAPAGLQEDAAMVTFDLLRTDAAGPQDTWTVAHFQLAESRIQTLLTSLSSLLPASHTRKEVRWYRKAFNPLTTSKAIADSGPPVRVLSLGNTPFGGPGPDPYQVAMSVTERTALPKHWGRFYLPISLGATWEAGASTGRFKHASMDTVALAVKAMYEGLHTDNLAPCVPITQLNKGPARALVGISHVRVDDIPDIQRRRRPGTVAYRAIQGAA